MTDIRTPEDEVTAPGFFYPPFKEGWTYEGQTYGGHTDFSVDWNRRVIKDGRVIWVDDRGDPVYAQQDGTVAAIEASNGAVFINHFGGTYRTESRHMAPVLVKIGQKVKRGDIIGRIGAVGISPSSGFTPSPHLHVVHWKKKKDGWERIQQSYEGKPVRVSVGDSGSRPKSWNPPAKVYLEGPPPKATWESAFKESQKAYGSLKKDYDQLKDYSDDLVDDIDNLMAQRDTLTADLQSANDRIAILESAQAPDLTAVKREARQSFKDEVLAIPA